MDHQQEMAYSKSNGHVIDDITTQMPACWDTGGLKEILECPISVFFHLVQNHQLDGHGKARREAARRRKSECKINFNFFSGRRNSSRVMAGRMKNFSENTSTIP